MGVQCALKLPKPFWVVITVATQSSLHAVLQSDFWAQTNHYIAIQSLSLTSCMSLKLSRDKRHGKAYNFLLLSLPVWNAQYLPRTLQFVPILSYRWAAIIMARRVSVEISTALAAGRRKAEWKNREDAERPDKRECTLADNKLVSHRRYPTTFLTLHTACAYLCLREQGSLVD